LLVLLGALLRLPFGAADGAFRFLEGAETVDETSVVSGDLSRALLCERFRDLVVGPATGASATGTSKTDSKGFVLSADVDAVTAAILRVRCWWFIPENLGNGLVAVLVTASVISAAVKRKSDN